MNRLPADGRVRRYLMSALLGLAVCVGIALVGVHGVTACAVQQRQREIAMIRSALGASATALAQFFLAEVGRVVAVGAIAGTVSAFWIGILRAYLFGVSAVLGTSVRLALLIVACGCTFAAWVPGRRAASISPAAVLRAE